MSHLHQLESDIARLSVSQHEGPGELEDEQVDDLYLLHQWEMASCHGAMVHGQALIASSRLTSAKPQMDL